MAWIETLDQDLLLNSEKIDHVYFTTTRLRSSDSLTDSLQELKILKKTVMDIRIATSDTDAIVYSLDITDRCREYARSNDGKEIFRQYGSKVNLEMETEFWRKRRHFIDLCSAPLQYVYAQRIMKRMVREISEAKKEQVLNFFALFRDLEQEFVGLKDSEIVKEYQESLINQERDGERKTAIEKFLRGHRSVN